MAEDKKARKLKKAKSIEPKAKKGAEVQEVVAVEETVEVKKAPARVRGARYVQARAKVDKTHTYSAVDAMALAKKTHIGRFSGSMEAHLVLRETGLVANVAYPNSTGRTIKVAVATDELLAEIEKGSIDFSILVAHPSMMPKLAKLAKVLGPKGLMPNPKNGTISPDPEKRKAELEAGSVTIKTERKAPLAHVIIGKLSMSEQQLAENLQALLKAFPAGKVLKCSVCSSMGPSIRVSVE
ncbi:MAG: 50S ribosomal protein L1 [Microgenomates group bacterium GW2011_GWF2_45_18]|nr:MAG: 50S ribosomal protein L1 [Microgenomates group bacterium GW2011_GWF1_44_10]KKU01354.1 MAG: 50S ribosomal protein L1 [Microgenomates group bacterium GW2011_GWF2_45_18]HAU99369.1 hypothetical protein [Candidatus Paceibacterota bacterium]HAX01347.1 hypothetical protein [Candidatus Paceibacterota bacterium]